MSLVSLIDLMFIIISPDKGFLSLLLFIIVLVIYYYYCLLSLVEVFQRDNVADQTLESIGIVSDTAFIIQLVDSV